MNNNSYINYIPIESITNYIPLDECKHGYVYRIHSRNLDIGVYDENDKGFIGIRTKFTMRYLFTEDHWDTGAPYGTVKPVECLHKVPPNIEISDNDKLFEYLDTLKELH